MALGAIKAGATFVEAYLKDNTPKQLKAMQQRFKATGAAIARVGAGIAAFGAAGVGFATGAVIQFARVGDQIDKMSQRTGVGAEALSTLGFAADRSGASLADVENGVRGMQRQILNLRDGLSTAVDSFDQLGISIESLDGLSPDEQFKLIASRLTEVTDESTRAGLAMRVFGRSGTALLPMLADMESLQAEAKRLNLEISGPQAKAAAEFTDAWGDVKSQFGAIVTQIGAALAPSLTKLLNTLTPVISSVIEWIKNNPGMVQGIAAMFTGAAALGSALVGLGVAIMFIIPALSALWSAGSAVIGFVFTPLGAGVIAAAAAIGVLGYGLYQLIDWFLKTTETGKYLVAMFNEVYAVATKVMGGIFNAIAKGDLQLAGEIAMDGLKIAFQAGLNELRPFWHSFLDFMFKNFGTAIKGISNALAKAVAAMAQTLSTALELAGFKSAAEKVTSLKEGVENFNLGINALTDEKKRKQILADATKAGDDALADLIKGLQEKLDRAKIETAADTPAAIAAASGGMPGMADISRSSFGTFSAAQALALGSGSNGIDKQQLQVAQRQEKALNKIVRNTGLPPGWAIQ